jgi:hypothetical protein
MTMAEQARAAAVAAERQRREHYEERSHGTGPVGDPAEAPSTLQPPEPPPPLRERRGQS